MTDDQARGEANLVLAAALAALAGAVDAYGLARLHDLYVSFMSGNTTSFGVALGSGDWGRAATAGGLIGLFVAGAAAGELLAVAAGRRRLPVVTMVVAAGLAVPLAAPAWTLPALVLTMGALNASLQKAGGTAVSLTYVTGTLVRLGQGLGNYVAGRAKGWSWLYQAAPWLGLLAGAVIATWLQAALGPGPLWPLPLYAALLAAAGWLLEW